MFHNPYNVTNNVASHYSTLHCTQERVYPLYSLVLIFYGFSLVFLLLFRPLVSSFLVQVRRMGRTDGKIDTSNTLKNTYLTKYTETW